MMYEIVREGRKSGNVVQQNQFFLPNVAEPIEYLTFPILEKTGIVEHLFTTRLGGVSQGVYASMNISFDRGDDEEAVLENYKRVACVMGCDVEQMVVAKQTHTTNIRKVTLEDVGKGVLRERDYDNIDGLITNEPSIALVTMFADCVPLYFVDVKNDAIGLAHSGWRGTVGEMGLHMVREMERVFGTRPEDLYAAIGPSICQACYEVSEDVKDAFNDFVENEECKKYVDEIKESGCYATQKTNDCMLIQKGKSPGKYQLDLWLMNAVILRKAGIPLQQIQITDLCTCHNADYLFSHRASHGKRGNLGAFLMLRKER